MAQNVHTPGLGMFPPGSLRTRFTLSPHTSLGVSCFPLVRHDAGFKTNNVVHVLICDQPRIRGGTPNCVIDSLDACT